MPISPQPTCLPGQAHPVPGCVQHGRVVWAPAASLWFTTMAIGTVVGGSAYFSWSGLLLFVVSTAIVLLLGHSLGMHRRLIHDSFQCPRWLEYALVYCGVLVGLNGPLGMVRAHDLRDYAQRQRSCHDYLRHGRSPWRDAWWQLHCSLRLDNPPLLPIAPRIAQDKVYQWLQATWMAQQLPWAVAFFLLGGWGWVFWGVCARVTAGVFGHWLIGYLAHNHGQMGHRVEGAAVQGRNVRLASLLTMGECWHNNHHAFPGSARLGLQRGEWDPGWWVLCALRRAGLVWQLKLPGDLAPRPELRPLPRRSGDRVVRVNHAGEHGAVCLYAGQIAMARRTAPRLVAELMAFHAHEQHHRALFADELARRGLRQCMALACCGVGGYTLGMLSGLFGRKVMASTTVAIERVVLAHLDGQIRQLRAGDPEAANLAAAIVDDERAHHGQSHRHIGAPGRLLRLWSWLISGLTECVIRIGLWMPGSARPAQLPLG